MYLVLTGVKSYMNDQPDEMAVNPESSIFYFQSNRHALHCTDRILAKSSIHCSEKREVSGEAGVAAGNSHVYSFMT